MDGFQSGDLVVFGGEKLGPSVRGTDATGSRIFRYVSPNSPAEPYLTFKSVHQVSAAAHQGRCTTDSNCHFLDFPILTGLFFLSYVTLPGGGGGLSFVCYTFNSFLVDAAIAMLTLSWGRRGSTYPSTSKHALLSMMLSLLLCCALFAGRATASVGDRLPEFRDCVQVCPTRRGQEQ